MLMLVISTDNGNTDLRTTSHYMYVCDTAFCRLINLVAKGVTTVSDMLSKVESLLDDCLTTVKVQYTGMFCRLAE